MQMKSEYYCLSFCCCQNGGAPLLYAVHGNHVRCVEILLGESLTVKCVSGSEFTKMMLCYIAESMVDKLYCICVYSREWR